jgi:hypothetical protein
MYVVAGVVGVKSTGDVTARQTHGTEQMNCGGDLELICWHTILDFLIRENGNEL